ncbi:RipA family octameric membrane protein [Sulfurospirillum arsenophilum]|uniref:RipA family octameric membrane protein n=1 Tax=Sulfurospirillum arsenophilum TaxID=56698 RepID=UPI000694FCFC|nr:TIR domain-containing protein [Sulfurospirillum arsenophilum]
MKLFVIHRFQERDLAKRKLKNLAKELSIELSLIFLDSSYNEEWKEKAINAIAEAEAVLVFNPQACNESKNAKWEIEKARESNKEIINFDNNQTDPASILKLKSLYDLKEEFEKCFVNNSDQNFDLYKLMIDSSDKLIERRQKTSAFFITVIGSLLAIAGLLVKTDTLSNASWLLYGFSLVGLLLCNSWGNLIDNYGKLNKAKFDVILRLEKELSSQIYLAEWVSLGKGLRPKKYKSFTATEKHVPLLFAILIGILTLITLFMKHM